MAATRRARTGTRPRLPDARARMITGAIDSLRVHGASATSIDRVLAATGAPRGSVYHHFPGGRTELLGRALDAAGATMSEYIEHLTRTHDPMTALEQFAALWRHTLCESDFRAGCPVFAIAVETNDDAPELAGTAAEIFARWHRALTEQLLRHDYPPARATRLASLTVAAIEGAIVLCRIHRETTPLEDTVTELRVLYTGGQ
ncbi:TetR/AcrR family transcriptional regulator [Nocardia sp. NPDC127579]|uniref:TetR/AcrR family transcriptional regulator n=1 Tax=Nocardia sp. NPDC127579 TaxID=3345402 RepID=UPI0036276B8E